MPQENGWISVSFHESTLHQWVLKAAIKWGQKEEPDLICEKYDFTVN